MLQRFLTPGVKVNIIDNAQVTPLPTGPTYLGLYAGNRGPDIQTYVSPTDLTSYCGPENPNTTRGLSSILDLLSQSNNVMGVRITRPLQDPVNTAPVNYDSYAYVKYDNASGWVAPTTWIGNPQQYTFGPTEVFSIFGLGSGNYYNNISVSIQYDDIQEVYVLNVYDDAGVLQETFDITFTITQDGTNMQDFAESVINGSSKYIQIRCNYSYIISQETLQNPDFFLNPSFNMNYNVANVNYSILNSNFVGFSTCSDSFGNMYIVGGNTYSGTTSISQQSLTLGTIVYQYNVNSKTWFALPNNSIGFSKTHSIYNSGPVSWYSSQNGGMIYTITNSTDGSQLQICQYSLSTYQWTDLGNITLSPSSYTPLTLQGQFPSALVYINSVGIEQPVISYIYTAGSSSTNLAFLAIDTTTLVPGTIVKGTVSIPSVSYPTNPYTARSPELLQFSNPITGTLGVYALNSLDGFLYQLNLSNAVVSIGITKTTIQLPTTYTSNTNPNSYDFQVATGQNPIDREVDTGGTPVNLSVGNTSTLDLSSSINWVSSDGNTLFFLVKDINDANAYIIPVNLQTQIVGSIIFCSTINYSFKLFYTYAQTNGTVLFSKPGTYSLNNFGVAQVMGSLNSSGTLQTMPAAYYILSSLLGQSSLYNGTSVPVTIGSNGSYNTADLQNSLTPLYNMETYPEIDLICDSGFNDTPAMQLALDALASTRQDAEVIDSIPSAYQYSEAAAAQYRQSLNINDGYSFLVTPGQYVRTNSYTGAYGLFPMSGAVSANVAFNDLSNGPWQTPAGPTNGLLSLINKLPPAVPGTPLTVNYKEISYTNTNLLAANQVNIVGRYNSMYPGVYLKTDYVLDSDSDSLQALGVRRTVNYIAVQAAQMAVQFLYLANNVQTRATVQETYNRFLAVIASAPGSLYSYSVVCNNTNNSAVTIDNNLLIVNITITPQETIRGIVLNIQVNNLESSVNISVQ